MAIRVYACGYNSFGNLGNNSTVQTSSPIIMSTTGWYQMPVGSSTMAAIGIDRNVYTWGSGNSGALGNDTTNISVSSPIQITSDGTWSMVGGGYFFVALKNDGTIWSWGNGSQGGIGNSLKINISSMIQIGTENNWTFVTANQQAGCAFGIKTDGSLWSWGSNLSGQQGRNTTVSVSSPVQVGTASNWSQIACGQSSFAIKTDGTLWATGDGTSGNNGLNRVTAVSSWTQVGAGTDWAYCCSQSNNMALKKNGTLWVWGLNSVGNLGDGTVINKSSPIQIAGSWTMATAQGDGYKGVKTDGTLWSWGASTYGQIADGFAINRSSPVQILIGSGPFTNLGYNNQQLWVQADGPTPTPTNTPSPTPSPSPSGSPSPTPSPTTNNYNLYGWGQNGTTGLVGNNSTVNVNSPVLVMSSIDPFVPTTGKSSALLKYGQLYTWGRSASGESGRNTTVAALSPVLVGLENNWVFVCTGYNCGGIKSDGSLWMWGTGANGCIGDGVVVSRSSPVQIAGSWSVVRTTSFSSPFNTVAIRTDGTLWAWGDNSIGQLGQNDLISRSSPVQIGNANNYIDCAYLSVGLAPPFQTSLIIALRADGTLWAVGNGAYEGRTGTGVLTNYSSITQIGTSTDWASFSGTTNCVGAIKKDGTLWMWGTGGNGALGLGNTISRSSPTQMGTGNDWAEVQCNYYYGMARKTNGTIWSWGIGGTGNLGNGTVSRSSPLQIGPSTNAWYALGGGEYTSFGIRLPDPTPTPTLTPLPTPPVQGDIFGWGIGTTGQLAQVTKAVNSSSPVIMPNYSWAQVAGIYSNFACVTADGNLVLWGANGNGQFGIGNVSSYSSPVINPATGVWASVSGGVVVGAIKKDGTLWMAGQGNNGALGTNTAVGRSSFVQVGAATDWTKISCSAYGNGSVFGWRGNNTFAWGENTVGQLGIGTIVNVSTPVLIDATGSWQDILTGNSYSIGLKKDGTLWATGMGSNGRTGLNSTTNRSSWTQIGTSNDWGYVAVGNLNVGAVKKDGTAWIWGAGTNGANANNSITDVSSPLQIGSATNWRFIGVATSAAGAVKSDGTLWMWGVNTFGNLGNNTTVNYSSPVQTVYADTSWVNIIGGLNGFIGYRIAPSPTATTTPTVTASPTPTPSESPSPTPSPSPSNSPSPSPSPSHSPSPTPSPTNSPSPTPSPSPSPSPTTTATPFPSQSPFPTLTPQPTQSPQPTFTPQPTLSPVPTVTPFPTTTQDPTPTGSPTPLPTDTPQPTVTPVPTVTPFPTLTPLPTFTPVPTYTPQPTPVYPATNNYILVPYQNNMNVTNIVPSQEGYAFNNGGGSGINLLLQFMQNDPTPQQVYIELTNNSSVDMVITVGNLVYVIEPGQYFNTVALMPFGQKVTVQSSESSTFTPSSVYGQIFVLPTPTPTPAEILKLQRNIIAVEGDAGSVDTGLINGTSIQRTGYITITENVTQVKVMEIPDGGLIDKTIQQIPEVIPLVCSGYLWVGDV